MKALSRFLCGPVYTEVEGDFENTQEYMIGEQRVRDANPGFDGIRIMPRDDGHNPQRALAWRSYVERSVQSLQLYEWQNAAPEAERPKRAQAINEIVKTHGLLPGGKEPVLNLSGLGLTSMPSRLSEFTWIKELNVRKNRLTTLPALPEGLLILKADYNKLIRLPPLPQKIECLRVRNNELNELPPLPLGREEYQWSRFWRATHPVSSFLKVDFRNNNLTEVPQFFRESRAYGRLDGNPWSQQASAYWDGRKKQLLIETSFNPFNRQIRIIMRKPDDPLWPTTDGTSGGGGG